MARHIALSSQVRLAKEEPVRQVMALVVMVWATAGLAAEPWSVVGQNAYGCASAKDLAQLRLMSAIKAAFEIALADKIENGSCVKLQAGEAASKVAADGQQKRDIFKVRRADGSVFFVDARFVERTL